MKKETIFFVALALAAGVLLGVIYSNLQKKSSKNPPATAAAPVQAPVNYQQQITMLEGILVREPENRNAWVQLGHNFFDADQPMRAIDAYAKALELDANDPNILTDQGVMYRRVGWFDKAITNFKKANELNSNHQQSLYNLGIVYRYDLQDFDNAIEVWTGFLALNPSGAGADQIRAEVEFLKTHPKLPPQPK